LKNFFKIVMLLAALSAAAWSQTTPYLNFNIPTTGTSNWGTLLNNNFSALDTFLGAGSRTAGQVAVWQSSGLTSYSGFTTDTSGNITVNSVTSAGAGSFLTLSTSGSNAGMIGLGEGADNSSNCGTGQICDEAPANGVTAYTKVRAATGPSNQSVPIVSALSNAKINESFVRWPVVLVTSFTTTANTSDNVTVSGMTSSGHCTVQPTNSGAAGGDTSVYVSAKATNQITVAHTATSGWTFDVLCTYN